MSNMDSLRRRLAHPASLLACSLYDMLHIYLTSVLMQAGHRIR
jgi:hypothetical protein